MTSIETTNDVVDELYERHLEPARSRYTRGRGFEAGANEVASDEFLLRFLIEFCSLGVQMTEPVDRWIRGAGTRCCALGFDDLGSALIRHAEHEAGHHEMLIADTHRLCAAWNSEGRPPLDADALVNRPPSAGVQAYIDLHESTIESAEPWGQLAIEYEIELLSVTSGPVLIANVARVCGPDRVADLSFLEDHIEIDAGHTVFNRRQLAQQLSAHPEMAPGLVSAGAAALDAHALFLDDCLDGALPR